jgi:hypothetical protein
MIVAMIALAVALSGTAVAGTKLITGSQIKNGTIKLADLHSSVKAAIKSESHTSGAQGLAGAQGAQGPAGPQGAAGAKGDTGATGTPGRAGKDGKDGISGLVTRHYDYIKDDADAYPGAGSGAIATVACDDDPAVSQTKVAIGGGVQFLNVGRNALQSAYVGDTHITDSFPGRMDWNTNTPKANRLDGWIVRLNTTPSVDMRVWVTCVDASPASPAS